MALPAGLEKLKVPAWVFAFAAVAFVVLLSISYLTGRSLSWSPLGFVQLSSGHEVTSCKSLTGRWRREGSTEEFQFKQAANCIAFGRRGDDEGAHEMTFAVAGSEAIGYVRRIVGTCKTMMGMTYQFVSDTELKTEEVVHGCDQNSVLKSRLVKVQ